MNRSWLAPWSSRTLARSVGASWRRHRTMANTCRCLVVTAGTLYSLKRQRQRRARTVTPRPPRTVEQPHACSISRSFIAAPLHSQTPADAWSRQQALSTQVPEAETNMDFESASALHRGAAASLHNQSELGGGSDTKPHICLQVPCRGGKQVLHSSAIGRDKHGRSVCLRFAPWSSRKLARSDGA